LKHQAEILKIRIEEISLRRTNTGFGIGDSEFGKKEEAVAQNYRGQWAYCIFDEGATIQIFLGLLVADYANEIARALQIPSVSPLFPSVSPRLGEYEQWAFLHAFRLAGHLEKLFMNAPPDSKEDRLHRDILDYLCSSAHKSIGDESEIRKTILALDSAVNPSSPRFDPRDYKAPYYLPYTRGVWLMSQVLDRTVVAALIRKYFTCYMARGWPDITLIGKQEIGFCEVKDKEKLHQAQFQWWNEIAPLFGNNAWIGKVKYAKRVLADEILLL
jgi:hypothetical protein